MRCPTCGTTTSLVQRGAVVRRHINPRVSVSAPRAERVCEASGIPLDDAPVRVRGYYEQGAKP